MVQPLLQPFSGALPGDTPSGPARLLAIYALWPLQGPVLCSLFWVPARKELDRQGPILGLERGVVRGEPGKGAGSGWGDPQGGGRVQGCCGAGPFLTGWAPSGEQLQ